MNIKLSDFIIKNFREPYKLLKSDKYLKYVFSGGRAGGKSVFICIYLLLDLVRRPITILCIRKVGNTIEDSIFETLKEVANMLNIEHLFDFKTKPCRIIYKERGNKIIFRGADDPTKIKSIKASKYPLTTVFIEECAEFKTEEEISVIQQSIVRGILPEGLRHKIILAYNPPKNKQHWLNQLYIPNVFKSETTYHHHSTYLDNPFVGDDFTLEAEEAKKRNYHKYLWEYLGEPVGSGIVPFPNLDIREITKKEIKTFDNISQSIDWGYSVDPLAFNRMHYDKKKRILYIYDEYHKIQCGNREIATWIKKKKYNNITIIADSSEPKSIAEVKSYGVKIKGAKKGAGSVESGEKWLGELNSIVIDPVRCPNTAREFKNADYDVDRYGNTVSRLQDKDNHHIDGIRYGCQEWMKNKKSFF